MLFNSGQFIIFFPAVVLLYYVIPIRVRHFFLLFASYFFYMCWNVKYSLILLFSTLITYIGALIVERYKRKGIAAFFIILNLSILIYFKYINFFISILTEIAGHLGISLNIPIFDLILPVGISFYTFQALGYLIDVYCRKIHAERNFLRYALFVSFFPQLVAGPIERSGHLLNQLSVPVKFDPVNIRNGLLTMIWGFFLKLVIADRCSVLVNTVYSAYTDYSGIYLVMANVFFALQIYCDFMGYSVIAKGASSMLGIDLIDNFRQPYYAASIRDFWKRWHISLSTWFMDYLYIPLGGNRCSRGRKFFNLFVTFLVSGLWHGAAYTFVIWGILHAFYQMIEDLLTAPANKLIHLFRIRTDVLSWKLIAAIKTFILTDIAWIFFRAESLGSALYILRQSFMLGNINLLFSDGIYKLGLNARNLNILFVALIPLFICSWLRERGTDVKSWILEKNVIFRYAMYWAALILIILSLDITGQEFIYFQF